MFGVVAPSEVADPEAHVLQEKYLPGLELIAQKLKSHRFSIPLLSRSSRAGRFGTAVR